MPAPRIHLRHDSEHVGAVLTARACCGVVAWNWTDDVQAVTCPACISFMELQPA